jgi:hypothetical protein
MIMNRHEYLYTQVQAERIRQALAAPDAIGLHPKAVKGMRDGLRSQLDDLEFELAEYDKSHQSREDTLETESTIEIGEVLIKA